MDWFSWENLATGHVVGFFIELDDGVFPVSPNPSQGSSRAVGFYQLIPSPHIQHPPKRNHGCFAWEFPDFGWHHAFLIILWC